MSGFKDLLKLKKVMKTKKPDFIRQDAHKKKRLEKKWRKPKGIQSKIRLNKKGHRKKVRVGYRNPKITRGLNNRGLKIVLINSLNDIKNIDKEKEGVVIASKVGLKRKKELIKNIIEKEIIILNIKDPKDYLNKMDITFKKKGEEKKKRKQIKEKKAKKKEKKTEVKKEEKDDLAEKIEKEEKDKEKKEKDKLLTKRV